MIIMIIITTINMCIYIYIYTYVCIYTYMYIYVYIGERERDTYCRTAVPDPPPRAAGARTDLGGFKGSATRGRFRKCSLTAFVATKLWRSLISFRQIRPKTSAAASSRPQTARPERRLFMTRELGRTLD